MSIVFYHPILIYCKYQLGLLLLEEGRFGEAVPFADYVIQHLPKYKFAYHLKARALVGLERLDEALTVYDDVITPAPNYGDAHVGRLNVVSALIDRREKADMQMFYEYYQTALKADPGVIDSVDEEVTKLSNRVYPRENRDPVQTPVVKIPHQESLLSALEEVRLSFIEELRIQVGNVGIGCPTWQQTWQQG
jgi:tetratricopeptide (TPR) repeat protein